MMMMTATVETEDVGEEGIVVEDEMVAVVVEVGGEEGIVVEDEMIVMMTMKLISTMFALIGQAEELVLDVGEEEQQGLLPSTASVVS